MKAGSSSTVDPLGGSFYVEHLTDAIEAEADATHQDDRRDGRNGRRDRERLRAAIDRSGRVRMVRRRSKRKSASSSASTITPTTSRRTCTSSKSAKRSASARSTGSTRSRRAATASGRDCARGPAPGRPGSNAKPDAADPRRRASLLLRSARSAESCARFSANIQSIGPGPISRAFARQLFVDHRMGESIATRSQAV